jgi:DNA repair protein RadC
MSTVNKISSEEPAVYGLPAPVSEAEQETIDEAIKIINRQWQRGQALTTPADTIRYLKVLIGHKEHEVFVMLMLDNRNRAICYREMFTGTIDGASIYPREIVKQALADNAAAVILAHNHPSGIADPSLADQRITKRVKDALALVDIRVLDHVIIGEKSMCFSERGLI